MVLSIVVLCAALCANAMDRDLVRAGIGKVFDREFEEARVYIEKGLEDRNEIRGFMKTWILLMENLDKKNPVFEKQCSNSCGAYEKASQGSNADSLLLGGMWQGLMALYLTGINETLAAYRYGARACEMLKKSLMVDPEKYDAYYGLGIYYKMRFELGQTLWFVPSSKNDRERAKTYLERAWAKGEFTRELSAHQLIDISAVGMQ